MITGFDFDGTLVRSFTAEPLPGAWAALQPYRAGLPTFIATNQAGLVYREMTGDARYPTVKQVAENITHALKALAFRPSLLLVAVHSGREGADWQAASNRMSTQLEFVLQFRFGLTIDVRVSPQLNWRKPNPRMLTYAAEQLGTPIQSITYIGDMESDQQAAEAAGCQFTWANDWLYG